MNSAERIALIREKVDRSKKHLDDLVIARNRFFDPKPYVFESKRDPQTGFDIFSVTNLKAPPHEIGLIAGDVIHNLRSALDHLAFQLMLANNQVPDKHTCFPIFDDGPTYNANRARRVRGMAQAAIHGIDAAKPYEGGTNELWCLHRLDIADKHHSLLVTLVSVTEMVAGSEFVVGRLENSEFWYSVI